MDPNNQTQPPTPDTTPEQPITNNQVDIPKELDFNEDNLGPGTEDITDTSPSVETVNTTPSPTPAVTDPAPANEVINPLGAAPVEKKKTHLVTWIALGAVVLVAIALVVFVFTMS